MGAERNTTIPRIVILGAGFGGLYTALHLVKALRRARRRAEITLLDRNNYFLFSPLLHEVMVEMVGMNHVVHPVRQFLRGTSVRFHETLVTDIDAEHRVVATQMGEFPYEYLVVALGGETNYFGMDSVRRAAFPLKELGDAFRLRNHVLTMFEKACNTTDSERRKALLTFVQVGAGFTGLETVTELHDFIHEALLRDYPMIRPNEVRLLLADALADLQCPTDPGLARVTKELMARKGIEVRFNTPVRDAGPGWAQLGEERVPTYTLIWAAGITANPLVAELPGEKGSQRRVVVAPTLQVPDHPEIFALGDCACCPGANGAPLPMTAQVANQQSPVVAQNLVRALTGTPLRAFQFKRLGELASLGTYQAVAEMGPFRLHGALAWWLWRTVYLAKMPWWEDRLRIAADWTLDLFFPRDTSRVEVGPCLACPLPDCPGCRLQTPQHREEDLDPPTERR